MVNQAIGKTEVFALDATVDGFDNAISSLRAEIDSATAEFESETERFSEIETSIDDAVKVGVSQVEELNRGGEALNEASDALLGMHDSMMKAATNASNMISSVYAAGLRMP